MGWSKCESVRCGGGGIGITLFLLFIIAIFFVAAAVIAFSGGTRWGVGKQQLDVLEKSRQAQRSLAEVIEDFTIRPQPCGESLEVTRMSEPFDK